MICEINSRSPAAEDILPHRPQHGWVRRDNRIHLNLCCCATKIISSATSFPLQVLTSLQWWASSSHLFPLPQTDYCVCVCVFPCITVRFILCVLQFSALYPEMVDALVLLDSFGFLPTDSVRCNFDSPGFPSLWSLGGGGNAMTAPPAVVVQGIWLFVIEAVGGVAADGNKTRGWATKTVTKEEYLKPGSWLNRRGENIFLYLFCWFKVVKFSFSSKTEIPDSGHVMPTRCQTSLETNAEDLTSVSSMHNLYEMCV